jgi:RNA polymerase sigma factor (sigma-70 family)
MVMRVGRSESGALCFDDEARFARLYDLCHQPIRDFCSRRVNADVVDDAVAETFLTGWRRIGEVPAGDDALVWLYGVAFRVIGRQWRGAARRGRLQDRLRTVRFGPVLAADESWADADDHRLVRAALDRLGETDAEVLRLVVWEQLSLVDVAAVLGIAPDAARQRLHRARRNLARQYDRLQSRSASTPAARTGGAR